MTPPAAERGPHEQRYIDLVDRNLLPTDVGTCLSKTHIAMNEVPDGTVNLYGHVHNNEPLREGPYVNICVEHTEYRPLPLDAVRRLALARLDDPRPRAATTAEEIRCLDA